MAKTKSRFRFLKDKTLLQKITKESEDNVVLNAAINRLNKIERGLSIDTKNIGFIVGGNGEITVESNGVIKGAKEFRKVTFKEANVMLVP